MPALVVAENGPAEHSVRALDAILLSVKAEAGCLRPASAFLEWCYGATCVWMLTPGTGLWP
jgi:hypothetical protein